MDRLLFQDAGVSGAVAKFTPNRRHQMVTARYLREVGPGGDIVVLVALVALEPPELDDSRPW